MVLTCAFLKAILAPKKATKLNNNIAHWDLITIYLLSNGVLLRNVNNERKKAPMTPDAFPKKAGKRFW